MSVDLPTTENTPAKELAQYISDIQLGRAIAYLELVRVRKIMPGPEIERLLGADSLLTWTIEELVAIQNRLALALCKQKSLGYAYMSRLINQNIFRYRREVFQSYTEYRGKNGKFNSQSRNGSDHRSFGR